MKLQKEEKAQPWQWRTQMPRIKVTQIKSPIGRKSDQRKTLIGLGLNKISRVKEFEDTASIRGAVNKVKHLLKIESI